MDEATQQALVITLRKAAEAHAELLAAMKRIDDRLKGLEARVDALERLRKPRTVPPSREER